MTGRTIHRLSAGRPALVGFVALAVAIALAFGFSNAGTDRAIHHANRQVATALAAAIEHSDHNHCLADQRTWDVTSAAIVALTEHTSPPPDQSFDPAVVERYARANGLRDAQRTVLLGRLRSRPIWTGTHCVVPSG